MSTSTASESGGPRQDQENVWSLELDMFEGPLDLLLHLVRSHELDILDIPIAFVCEKYLEYLALLRALDLEVAGDYLVMAATLAYLKSRELLPTEPEASEGEFDDELGPDPREALIARLLEYQKYRAAADQLDRMPISGRDVFARGQDVDLPPLDAGLAPVTLFRLAEAFHRVLERARIHRSHDVVLERVSVVDGMRQLALLLETRERVDFERLFLERTWSSERELRAMLVVTLMSILELVKLGVAQVHQPTGSTAIVIERAADKETVGRALAAYESRTDVRTEDEDEDEDEAEADGGGPDQAPPDAAGENVPLGADVAETAGDEVSSRPDPSDDSSPPDDHG